jgi:sulfate adenylyltransferase/3'-phosphoadenosine 5'-phosphosulfate synthase
VGSSISLASAHRAAALRRRFEAEPRGALAARSVIVWLTGLSGSGKSTIAKALSAVLASHGRRVQILDGDRVRDGLSKDLGYSRDDRNTHIRRIGFVADLLTSQGIMVIVAAISPYREVRDELRSRLQPFVEVHVDCPLDELLRRDVKGLYARALAGEVKQFTGISDPYEAPLQPDLRLNTHLRTVDQCVNAVLDWLRSRGHLDAELGLGLGIRPHGGALRICLVPPERVSELDRESDSLVEVELDPWAVTDLELLAGGALSPLTGFMTEADLLSVRDRMRLVSGLPWTLPILLPVEPRLARSLRPAQRIALRYRGRRLAVLTVNDAYRYDRRELARQVYGTVDQAHPGVSYTLGQTGFAVGGEVEVIHLPPGPFAHLSLTPTETRTRFARRGWKTIVGFQTRNPVHRAHEYLLKVALEQVDGLLLHPLVGETKEDDVPARMRLRCYEVLLERHFPPQRVLLAAFPASMRYAGPREAVFHALVRQNYGCTHFIVGRDHAGVGSYYGSYAAQEIFDSFAPGEIAIQVLRFEHAFFCTACEAMATTRTCPHPSERRIQLSGTGVRDRLRRGEQLPAEFTRPEIAEILRTWVPLGGTRQPDQR